MRFLVPVSKMFENQNGELSVRSHAEKLACGNDLWPNLFVELERRIGTTDQQLSWESACTDVSARITFLGRVSVLSWRG